MGLQYSRATGCLCSGKPSATLAALSHRFAVSFEKTSGAIPFSRVAMADWQRLEPDVSKETLPWALACLMTLWRCHKGNATDPQAAPGVVVQFDLYPRPCDELIFATVKSGLDYHVKVSRNAGGVIVAPSTTTLMSTQAATATTKVGNQNDTVLCDTASRANIDTVFLTLLRDAASRGETRLLCLRSYVSCLNALNRAARVLQLPLHVTAHLPRHGGASEDHYAGARDLRQSQIRGRCGSFTSVRRYQKSGRLLAVLRRASPHLLRRARAAAALKLNFLLHVR